MSKSPSEPEISNLPALPARHDGWDGPTMAKFLEGLAETGIVADACSMARKSREAAYRLRRRNSLFAAAWETALGAAREQLADELLARSLEGNVERIIRDGEIVGEKHFLDNRLGLAILRRLDRRAEPRPPRGSVPVRPAAPDWDKAVDALRTGDEDAIAAALAMLRAAEVDEVDRPPLVSTSCAVCAEIDALDTREPEPRCWREGGEWWTDFQSPDGHDDDGNIRRWGEPNFRRLCTDDEVAILEAGHRLTEDERRAEAHALRDRFFAEYAAELDAEGVTPLVERIKAALSQVE